MISTILTICLVVLVTSFLLIAPVKWAAKLMGAKRTGVLWCLLALLCAGIISTLGLSVPVAGSIVAFLLSSIVFAAVLGTDFIRGVGIAVLHFVFSLILLVIIITITGITLASLLVRG